MGAEYGGRTVGELIALLRQYPADMPVRVCTGDPELFGFSVHAEHSGTDDGWDGDPCEVLYLDVTG